MTYFLFTFKAGVVDDSPSEDEAHDGDPLSAMLNRWSKTQFGCATVFLLGAALLVIGAEAMVRSGVALAVLIGVSESVIALTVTAVGTGIPEIAATAIAVARP